MTNSSQPDNSIAARLEESGGQMTFFEHLSELRKRIINSLYAIGAGAFVGVYLSKYFIKWITDPIIKALTDAKLNPHLFYTHPAGYLNTYITLGVYLGIVLASPVVLYQVWLFVAPAPVNEYFDLVLLILLSLGIVFELPILIFFLTLFGIVTPGFLWKNFRYAILVIAVVAAIVTPTPDAMTMLVFMMPMVGLYFVGIAVSAIVMRKKRKRLEAESAGTAG